MTLSIPGIPDNVQAYLRELEHRVAVLETSSRLYNSAIREGTLRIQDSSGNPMVTLGKLDDGSYGIIIQNSTPSTLMRVDSVSGQVFPRQLIPLVYPNSSLVSGLTSGMRPGTNSATFVSLYTGRFSSVGNKIDYDITVFPNAGNMDWQIICQEFGVIGDQVIASGSGETANVQRTGVATLTAANLTSGSDPAGRQMFITLQARKNSGPSTVDINMNNSMTNRP